MQITSLTSKHDVFQEARDYINSLSLKVVEENVEKPWGGYFRIDDKDTDVFIDKFYGFDYHRQAGLLISPKILIIAPHKRLSWQYHYRRSEVWKVIKGRVGVVVSNSDLETETKILTENETISIGAQMRHRIVGLDEWGYIAEIWQHTLTDSPSNEEDIVRVSDDFGRESA